MTFPSQPFGWSEIREWGITSKPEKSNSVPIFQAMENAFPNFKTLTRREESSFPISNCFPNSSSEKFSRYFSSSSSFFSSQNFHFYIVFFHKKDWVLMALVFSNWVWFWSSFYQWVLDWWHWFTAFPWNFLVSAVWVVLESFMKNYKETERSWFL